MTRTKILSLVLEDLSGNAPFRYELKRLIHLGYTGRNQNEVQKHVRELKKAGAVIPAETPNNFVKSVDLLSTGDSCDVVDKDSTGEAEFALLIGDGEIFVAAASDHTDRKLGTIEGIEDKSKQITPSFISKSVWRYSEVKDYWDEIEMRSWIDADRKLYQETTLSALLTPQQLIDHVERVTGVKPQPGTVIFSGTVGALMESGIFSPQFKVELFDPRNKRRLECDYQLLLLTRDWCGLDL